MPARKIMVLRHAEKPERDVHGVDASGRQDSRELSVRGWQRAAEGTSFRQPRRSAVESRRVLVRGPSPQLERWRLINGRPKLSRLRNSPAGAHGIKRGAGNRQEGHA